MKPKFISQHADVKFVGKEEIKQKTFHKNGFSSFSKIRDSCSEIPTEGDKLNYSLFCKLFTEEC